MKKPIEMVVCDEEGCEVWQNVEECPVCGRDACTREHMGVVVVDRKSARMCVGCLRDFIPELEEKMSAEQDRIGYEMRANLFPGPPPPFPMLRSV